MCVVQDVDGIRERRNFHAQSSCLQDMKIFVLTGTRRKCEWRSYSKRLRVEQKCVRAGTKRKCEWRSHSTRLRCLLIRRGGQAILWSLLRCFHPKIAPGEALLEISIAWLGWARCGGICLRLHLFVCSAVFETGVATDGNDTALYCTKSDHSRVAYSDQYCVHPGLSEVESVVRISDEFQTILDASQSFGRFSELSTLLKGFLSYLFAFSSGMWAKPEIQKSR